MSGNQKPGREANGPVAATAGGPVLDMRGITAGYGRITVLRDVDVTVNPGVIDALIGPNGAGKTTLLRVASGLLRPDAGSVRVAGSDVSDASPSARLRTGLCMIPEGRGIFRSLSVHENLLLQLAPWDRKSGVERALDVFPVLRDRLRQRAGTLSGGQQQMLALARCFLVSPRVVLLDEVSMGLAPLIVDEIFESFTILTKQGISLLLVEQYVNRVLEIADHVHLLAKGAVSFSGPAQSLDADAVLSDYLGTSSS